MFPRYSWEHSGDKEARPARDQVAHFRPLPPPHRHKKRSLSTAVAVWRNTAPRSALSDVKSIRLSRQPPRNPCDCPFTTRGAEDLESPPTREGTHSHTVDPREETDTRDWIPPPASKSQAIRANGVGGRKLHVEFWHFSH